MLNNIRGILNRRSDQNRSPESLLSSKSSSDEGVENNASSAEGFLCPVCLLAFPSSEGLQDHYESTHIEDETATDGRSVVCPACKMKVGSEIELQSHFSRHHSDKEDVELKAMAMQVKALEEGKALLQSELQLVLKDRTRFKEEKDTLELKAAKLASDLADLKLNFDELNSKKMYLESALKLAEDKNMKLEVEAQQRAEEDDVIELKKGIKSVQEKMNELALQKEAEKDSLQKVYNDLKEENQKLLAEKSKLEDALRDSPKKEEMESLQAKISEMSVSISNLKEELNAREAENTKLHVSLGKFENYDEIKASLSKQQNSVEELLRQAYEKDTCINKLREELLKVKDEVKDSHVERERLFSEIAKGEGTSTAMSQLKEENTRLQEQFLNQQTLHLQAIKELETRISELRTLLKKAEASAEAYKDQVFDLETELKETKQTLQDIQSEKDSTSKDLNLQIANLSATQGVDKARLLTLESELRSLKKSYEEKCSELEINLKELKLERTSNLEVIAKLQSTVKSQEKYISELAEKLSLSENELTNKVLSLAESEETNKQILSCLEEDKKSKAELEEKHKKLQSIYLEAQNKINSLEAVLGENEATKIEFCDKISLLNEDLLKSQLKESELTAALANVTEMHSEVRNKCHSLEEEIKNMRLKVTDLQNEKNSLLNEIETEKKIVQELKEVVASLEKKIENLSSLKDEEEANYKKVLNEFQLAKDVYLSEKIKLQKQLENLENDCAKQLSIMQETVTSLEQQLENSEEQKSVLHSSLEEAQNTIKSLKLEAEETNAHHKAQLGLLSENIQTLKEDLASEQKRRENAEQKLDEISGTKLELEAKLENALEERSGLLKRCIGSEAECEKLQKSVVEIRQKYDDCVAALQELGRENQTLQVENMKHITRKWADDSEVTHCTTCGKMFSVTIRKHHCRNCGNIFCNECSSKTTTVAASKKPVRVCDLCYVEVTK